MRFCTSKASKLGVSSLLLLRARRLRVSICTFVPVKQVNAGYLRGLAAVEAREEVEDRAEAASDDL
jgi:hypothetical protein